MSLFFVLPRAVSATTNLSFNSDRPNVAVGQNFIVDIIAESSDTTFYSADFEISFNRAVIDLTAVEISAGSLLDCATGEVWSSDPYNAETGTIMAQVFRNGCSPLPVNSATILARLNFTATSAGTTNLKVENVDYRYASSLNETSLNKPSLAVNVLTSDAVSPDLSINAIAQNPTATSPITITGAVSDNVEVARVAWSNNRGGGGPAAVSAGAWTFIAPLEAGANVITVTATDTANNTASKATTITYAPAPAAVSLNPSTQNVNLNGSFNLTLRVNDVVNLENLTTDILFDSSKINYDHASISNDIAGLSWTAEVLECLTPGAGCKNLLVKSNLVNLLNGSANLITLSFTAKAAGTNSFTYANNHLYDGPFNEITASWNSAAAVIASGGAASNNCTSFTYSSYSACGSSGTQARTILTRLPANCAGGSPEPLTRACTYLPPAAGSGNGGTGSTQAACLIAEYNEWPAACLNGWQYRGVKLQSPSGCGLTAVQENNKKRPCPTAATPDAGGAGKSGATAKTASSTKAAVVATDNTTPASIAGVNFAITNSNLYNKLKGQIILKVQDKGQAYYISPKEKKAYYLGRPQEAFQLIRNQGLGITNDNLEKIPVNLTILSGLDSDSDGLPDAFEEAIGTAKDKLDTDSDGFNDKTELAGGFSPVAKGQKMNYNKTLANALKGRILLQVKHKGEAWYINPVNGQRYFLSRPADAFNLMRRLGLGITDSDYKILGGK